MTITLKTLSKATAQEVFDQVATHLLTQGEKSGYKCETSEHEDAQFNCYYRYEGMACAAGCLISDQEYFDDMEKRPWQSLAADGIVTNKHEFLIQDLQCIHDFTPVLNWYHQLWELAKRRNFSNDALLPFKPEA